MNVLSSRSCLDKMLAGTLVLSGRHPVICAALRIASLANPSEDRLLNKLLHSHRYNPLTIPIFDVGQTVHVKLGLGVQKIIQVVGRRPSKY